MMLIEKTAGEAYYKLLATIVPAAADLAAYEVSAAEGDGYSTAGDVAHIPISGVLTNRPSYIARYYGGGNTTYGALRSAIAQAEADPMVKSIQFDIDSPGGEIKGLFETMDLIAGCKKKTRAVVGYQAASAAYALASQADEIAVSSRASSVGSVGVLTSMYVDPEEVFITSTDAPKKHPDVTSEEGKAVVRERLDDIHALMAEYIAKGRGTTEDKVKSDYGKGGMLMAEDALAAGMIDSIEKPQTAAKKTKEVSSMDIATLKAEHPDTYAAAVAEGVGQERKRVCAHLKMGKTHGAEDIATKAIEEGKSLIGDEELMAEYLCAGKNKADVDARQEEAPAAVGTNEEGGLDENEKVLQAMENLDSKGMVIL